MKHIIYIPLLLIIGTSSITEKRQHRRFYIAGEEYVNKKHELITTGTQLQAMINATSRGDSLYLPAGLYLIDTPVNMWKPITLWNEHRAAVLRFTNNVDWIAYYKAKGAVEAGMLNIIADSTTVYGITFDQNYRHSGKGNLDTPLVGSLLIGGTYLRKDTTGVPKTTRHVTIRNCLFYDTWGNAAVAYGAVTHNLTIDSNTFVAFSLLNKIITQGGPLIHGRQQISVAQGDTIKVNDNEIYGTNDDAIALHTRITEAEVRRNYVYSGYSKGRIFIGGCRNTIVDSNIFTIETLSATGSSVWVMTSPSSSVYRNKNLTISNNVLEASGDDTYYSYGILLWGPGDSILVDNNTISGAKKKPTAWGVFVKPFLWTKIGGTPADTTTVNGTYITISNNKMANIKQHVYLHPNFPKDSVTTIDLPETDNLPR